MLLGADLTRSLAGGAALRRHLAPAPAHRARSRDGEATLTERDRPAAPALGTRRERRTGRASRAVARRADIRQREDHGNLPAERRHPERDRDGGLDFFLFFISAGPGTAPAEDRREQIPETAERAQVGDVEVDVSGARRRPASPSPRSCRPRERPIAPQLIVLLALLGIAQHVVRFVDLLEALGGLWVVGVAVRMVLLREPAKRLLYFVGGRRLRYAQRLVIVFRGGHQPASPDHFNTTTRAGRINAPPIW